MITKKKQAIKIPLNVDRINQILGINITEDQYVDYLEFLVIAECLREGQDGL